MNHGNLSRAARTRELKVLFRFTDNIILYISFSIECLMEVLGLPIGLSLVIQVNISLAGISYSLILIILPTKCNLLFAI